MDGWMNEWLNGYELSIVCRLYWLYVRQIDEKNKTHPVNNVLYFTAFSPPFWLISVVKYSNIGFGLHIYNNNNITIWHARNTVAPHRIILCCCWVLFFSSKVRKMMLLSMHDSGTPKTLVCMCVCMCEHFSNHFLCHFPHMARRWLTLDCC
jgi:hypothetical protein